MYVGKLIFSQLMDHLPMHTFRRCVTRYQGERYVKRFRCFDQYLVMAFAQLTHRESLRDIEACLGAHQNKLYHMGIRSASVARNTLSKANERRDWRIYADFAQSLIRIARPLYADEDLGLDLDNTVYALDASTIDLCLSVFPWALFRSTKSAIKLHTLLDLRGSIPSFIHISDGKLHDVNVLDILLPEPGAFYIMDRGYTDFSRLYMLGLGAAFFVIRGKSNLQCRRLYSRPVDKRTGLKYDQTVVLTGFYAAKDYPDKLRRIKYYDAKTDKTLVFLTNNFSLPALTIAELYRCRWQVELFFKWIKQHLRIKSFFGTSENAVKTQIWIAISVYVLMAIIKKRLDLRTDLYTILQILSLTLFEKTPLDQILTNHDYKTDGYDMCKQLNLFDNLTGQSCTYISIGFGAIIGIGWVIYAGQWLTDGGPVGAILAFVICGLLLLPIGACYAEMTSAIPVAGGELAFTYKAFGQLTAFLTAWALSLSYVAVGPFETIAIGALFETMLPALASAPLYAVDGYKVAWSTIVPGLAIGGYLTWLNYQGAKSSTRFQKWVMYLLLVCTVVFTATALSKGSISNLTPMFATEGSFWAVAPSSVIAVLVVAAWFMGGFDTIPQAAEESGLKMQPKQLGTAILVSIVMGSVFYVLIILAVGMSISPEQLSVMLQQKDVMPTAEVFRVAFGYEWATQLVLFAALLGLVTSLNGFYIASSRLLFSLGRGGMLPHWFAKVHDTHGTPSNAILFVGGVSLIGPLIGKAGLIPIVNSSALAFTSALFLTALSAIRLRQVAPELERPYRAHITTLYLGAIMGATLVLLMLYPGSPGQLSRLEFSLIAGWMVLGLLGYMIRQSKGDMDHNERSYLILGDYR